MYFGFPALSPDGKWLAVARVVDEESFSIWIKRLDRGPSIKLTLDGNYNYGPAWTPDGRSVTFSSTLATGATDLWTKRADGGAQAVMQLHERSEEHTSELQSLAYLVCRLLLEKKKIRVLQRIVAVRNS